jgi:hypothetical protein
MEQFVSVGGVGTVEVAPVISAAEGRITTGSSQPVGMLNGMVAVYVTVRLEVTEYCRRRAMVAAEFRS